MVRLGKHPRVAVSADEAAKDRCAGKSEALGPALSEIIGSPKRLEVTEVTERDQFA